MKVKIFVVLCAVLLAGNLIAGDGSNVKGVNSGGFNATIGLISPGSGYPPVPGGKIRGLTLLAQSVATTTGPAADLMNGFVGPVIINANLDENMAGPIWMTFEWSKAGGFTWAGTCNGQYDFALGAGSWKCEGNIQGPGLRHILTKNDTVCPGPSDNPICPFFGTATGLPED